MSERNCVEIISKLGELGLLDVYHTNDGKEYITPAQLSREIQDEVFLHGGLFYVEMLIITITSYLFDYFSYVLYCSIMVLYVISSKEI